MPEIQDILMKHGIDYCQNHSTSYTQRKVMNALSKCRTSSLGGHVTLCDECGHQEISYNSCRNRHCPKCQTLTKEKWIDQQTFHLLNVGYFHMVMTVPHTLHSVILQNQKVCYSILFKAVAETLAELSSDKKYLGAQIGFTGILHTWGQNLMFHPPYSLHCSWWRIEQAHAMDSLEEEILSSGQSSITEIPWKISFLIKTSFP